MTNSIPLAVLVRAVAAMEGAKRADERKDHTMTSDEHIALVRSCSELSAHVSLIMSMQSLVQVSA